MVLSFALLALSLLLICMGIQYPDLLIFLIGLILFLISSFQNKKCTRYFGWVAAFSLGLALMVISISPTKDQTPSIAPPEQIVEQGASIITEEEIVVYITPYGERYHLRSTCGGKNSMESKIEDATDAGYTPCQKCVD